MNSKRYSSFSKFHVVLTLVAVIAVVVILFANKDRGINKIPKNQPQDNIWPSAVIKDENIDQSNKLATINATYPITKDVSINNQFKDFVDGQITQFTDDISWASDPANASSETAKYLSIDITYKEQKVGFADNFIFSVETYTGGAHGSQVKQTFAYSPLGKLIKFEDLFSDVGKGLPLVSSFVQKEIVKRNISDSAWINDGAGPVADNYRAFIIEDNGLTFLFAPYQVASYASGEQSVFVPLSVFESVSNKTVFNTR